VAIAVTVIVLNQPYGNPGSLGEPLGIWSGVAIVGGDATGGGVTVTFEPQNPTTTPTLDDHRRQYVWFLDSCTHHEGPGDPGIGLVEIRPHWARPNFAIANPPVYSVSYDMLSVQSQRHPVAVRLEPAISRLPIFWDTQELAGTSNALLTMRVSTNVNNNEAEYSCYGRYYDRQILSNRGFGRLIAPPAVSQFA